MSLGILGFKDFHLLYLLGSWIRSPVRISQLIRTLVLALITGYLKGSVIGDFFCIVN